MKNAPLRQIDMDHRNDLLLNATRLSLTDFRGYAASRIEPAGRFVVLTGANGAGKTNLLEALSFLTPGRGLRRAKLNDVARRGGPGGWAVAARLNIDGMEVNAGVACQATDGDLGERRNYRLDGDKASATGLRQRFGLQWLTPRMDRLFVEGKAERRRFLDRLVYGGDPEHGRRVASYETALRERAVLLKRGQAGERLDATWLDAIEARLAADGAAIAAARTETVQRLNLAMASEATRTGGFPQAHLAVLGEVEASLEEATALAAEDAFARSLAANRGLDAAAGRSLIGPHRSDLTVTYVAKELPAEQCSTGEQKALLVAIILAEARLERAEQGRAPLLLLDEACAHLDAARRSALFDELAGLGSQVWLTGTDRSVFSDLSGEADFFSIEAHEITREKLNQSSKVGI